MENIREATLNDKDQIYRLLVVLEETTPDPKCFSDIYESNLSNPTIFYYVYERDYEILGFISIHIQQLLHHTSKIAEIQELIVEPTLRYQGIGKRLFQKVKEVSIENDCTQIEVCCNQRRTSSHKFYQSLGMTNNHYKFCLPLLY